MTSKQNVFRAIIPYFFLRGGRARKGWGVGYDKKIYTPELYITLSRSISSMDIRQADLTIITG